MIKKINIALVVAFVVLLVFKGLKNFKDARAKKAEMRQDAVAAQQEISQLAPCVYYAYWAGYTLENPISNRNGILLDIVRAIFPNATYRRIKGGMGEFAKILRDEGHAVVVGFGEHPALKGFPTAKTPLMHCPLVLMTIRTNPWRYRDASSLDGLRIVADESFLDYKVIRDLHERQGKGATSLRLMPSTVSKVELAEIVRKGEADAFAMGDLKNAEGADRDGLTSVRILQDFRKSKPIANDGTLFRVSAKDAAFAKRLIEDYEAGMQRIEKNGMRRRIFEYYGIRYESVKSESK